MLKHIIIGMVTPPILGIVGFLLYTLVMYNPFLFVELLACSAGGMIGYDVWRYDNEQ